MIHLKSTLKWDGRVTFGVLDENIVKQMVLAANPQALFHAIQNGDIQFKRKYEDHNTITNYARQYIVEMLTGGTTYPNITPSQMELGTGTGTPAPTDTDLFSPSGGTLKQCSGIQPYLTYYAQYITTYLSSDPVQGTWTEIGLKDSNGNLWAHAILTSGVPVNPGEQLVCQWEVQLLGN